MDNLNEYCLLEIIKLLNLNERSKLRLMNKRFKILCDSIGLEKLIIFDRQPIIFDKLKFTNEKWSLEDTVYVTDLDKFMKSYDNNLNSIETLVIISVNQGLHKFENKFNNLKHLELYNIKLKSTKIFESSKLKNIYLHETFFTNYLSKLSTSKLTNARLSVENYQSFEKYLNSINNLEILTYRIEPLKLYFLLPKLKLNIVKNLRIYPMGLNLMADFMSSKYKNLEKLDTIITDYNSLSTIIGRKKFGLSLLGIDVNDNKSLKFFIDFYKKLEFFIKYEASSLIVTEENLNLFNKFDQNKLIEFYKLPETLSTIDVPFDEKMYEKMINVNELIITLVNNSNLSNFKKLINTFSNISGFKIYQTTNTEDNYDLKLELICELKNLTKLKIALWKKIDYKFIVEMVNLKYLVILSLEEINYDLILELFKNLKHLAFLQLLFLNSNNDYPKEKLVEFKKKVIELLKDQSKYDDNIDTFKIDIIKETKFIAIRFRFIRSMYIEESLTYDKQIIQDDYKRFCDEVKYRLNYIVSSIRS